MHAAVVVYAPFSPAPSLTPVCAGINAPEIRAAAVRAAVTAVVRNRAVAVHAAAVVRAVHAGVPSSSSSSSPVHGYRGKNAAAVQRAAAVLVPIG